MATMHQSPQQEQVNPMTSEATDLPQSPLPPPADADSDTEHDDPGELLNMWLGELNTLKKVREKIV